MIRLRCKGLRASVLATAIFSTPMFAEARRLDAALEALLPTTAASDELEAVTSCEGAAPLGVAQRHDHAGSVRLAAGRAISTVPACYR